MVNYLCIVHFCYKTTYTSFSCHSLVSNSDYVYDYDYYWFIQYAWLEESQLLCPLCFLALWRLPEELHSQLCSMWYMQFMVLLPMPAARPCWHIIPCNTRGYIYMQNLLPCWIWPVQPVQLWTSPSATKSGMFCPYYYSHYY